MRKTNLIYIIDDDQDICDLASSELSYFGYEICSFNTGSAALRAIKRKPPALCVVDLGLPDMDGLALVKELFESPDIGVLILSGRGSLPDRVLGLELGADDYMTKPFEPRYLVARVDSLLRRLGRDTTNQPHAALKQAQFSGWHYNPSTLTLTQVQNGNSTILSTAEGDLLLTFLRAPKQILSRDRLLGEQAIPYDRSIDSRMSRLRKKLKAGEHPEESEIIKTVYGAGYMLACEVNWGQLEESMA